MNFVHQASVRLTGSNNDGEGNPAKSHNPASKYLEHNTDKDSSQKKDSFKLYRITFPQVKVQDPNIGCGHLIKLVNEWTLRKELYIKHGLQNAGANDQMSGSGVCSTPEKKQKTEA